MPFTCDCLLHSVPLTTSTQPQRPDFLCINITDCNVKKFGFNEHPLRRSSFFCIIFTGSKWDTVWLLRAIFGSASAFSSSFFHCDLWMIKRKNCSRQVPSVYQVMIIFIRQWRPLFHNHSIERLPPLTSHNVATIVCSSVHHITFLLRQKYLI